MHSHEPVAQAYRAGAGAPALAAGEIICDFLAQLLEVFQEPFQRPRGGSGGICGTGEVACPLHLQGGEARLDKGEP